MTVFDLDERQGVFFDMEGGGRIQLRSLSSDDLREIRKQTVKKKVDFKRLDGKPERFEFEEVNEELQNELFWDHVIMTWENFIDKNGTPIPCTKENKMLLLSRSLKFTRFLNEALTTLTETESQLMKDMEKN
jgi:hypothetical protein